jgi:hypothetical protein
MRLQKYRGFNMQALYGKTIVQSPIHNLPTQKFDCWFKNLSSKRRKSGGTSHVKKLKQG